MSEFGDFFGEVQKVAAVTSQAAAVTSGVFNTVSRLTNDSSLREFSQFAGGAASAAGNLSSGISNLSAINGNLFDPSNARLAVAGLNQLSNAAAMGSALLDQVNGPSSAAGTITYKKGSGSISGGSGGSSGGGGSGGSGYTAHAENWKVSLRCPGLNNAVCVFPVVPQITITDTAKYSSAGLVHANYAMQFYESSEVSAIQIQADYPVQDATQAQELLSSIYMFRAATKMFWGGDPAAGTPPPLVFLNGYGAKYFSNVPCIITNFTHTMPEDKDYIYSAGTRVPTLSQIGLTLQPVYSRNSLNQMSIAAIAAGDMLHFI